MATTKRHLSVRNRVHQIQAKWSLFLVTWQRQMIQSGGYIAEKDAAISFVVHQLFIRVSFKCW